MDWKTRIFARSTSADVPINFRFNVDAHTSILATRFYTLWAVNCLLRTAIRPHSWLEGRLLLTSPGPDPRFFAPPATFATIGVDLKSGAHLQGTSSHVQLACHTEHRSPIA